MSLYTFVNGQKRYIVKPQIVKLTLNVVPSDANITIVYDGQTITGQNKINVKVGSLVSYTVSKEGYVDATNTIIVNKTMKINVALEEYTIASGTVVFSSSTPGTYYVDVVKHNYNIKLVGAGSGGASTYINSTTKVGSTRITNSYYVLEGGGSGGYTNKNVYFDTGTLVITVGAGSIHKGLFTLSTTGAGNTDSGGTSSISDGTNIYQATGGTGAETYPKSSVTLSTGVNGQGGIGETSNGNNGSGKIGSSTPTNITSITNIAYGGESVYGGYGKGGDGAATSTDGGNGFVEIIAI